MVFLTGEGEFLAGRPYTPADEMVDVLQRVSSGEFVPGGAESESASRPHEAEASADAVMERLEELYDDRFGGFGVEPKQPPWEALSFLAARYGHTGDRETLRMITTTLDGMWNGIYDQKDQGFFRYAVSRDWKVPHYEKMLVTNASLALSYMEGYRVTGKPAYRTVVNGVLDYMNSTLFDPTEGLFFASQDADEPFYQMSWKDREAAAPPPIDRTFYAGWNALAARALIQASDVFPRPALLRSGFQVLDRLWTENWTAAGGLDHRAGPTGQATAILSDQVEFLRAWLALYQSTGKAEFLRRATDVAETTQNLFGAAMGGCYDTIAPSGFESRLLQREQPVRDNAVWAEALLTLAYLTGDSSYADRAGSTLDVFESVVPGSSYLGSHTSRRMEEDEEALFLPAGSAWGRAKDMQSRGPVSLVIVGDSSDAAWERLHRAALRVDAPHRIVEPLDSGRDAETIRNLGFPIDRAPALYACMGESCLAPITTPQAVRQMARSRPWATGMF